MKNKINLSKSSYVKGLQCPKALWFSKNRRDLNVPPDDDAKAKFAVGDEVTDLARQCFGGGVKADDDYFDINKAALSTQNLINQNHTIIFEATAIGQGGDGHARIDILQKNANAENFNLIEVKSSTSVKDYHIDDMSFQYHVFTKAGYKIEKCLLMILDKEYVLDGELDPNKLFKFEDISQQVLEKQNSLEEITNDLLAVLKSAEEPKIAIGDKCFKPFECEYKHHCWKEVPEYSIFKIYQNKKAEKIAKEISSYDIKDIPANLFPSTAKAIDVTCYQDNKIHLEKDKIKNWLKKLQYPLYFLDYETIAPAIPIFQGTRPYQVIPFQFSLHIQEKEGDELKHFEYLHKEQSDPRKELAKKLVEFCGDYGSIIVYHQSFEETRNKELARDFPQYFDQILSLNKRLVDLEVPFKKKYIYSPKQQSSNSIKKVLPAFTDDNSYKEMEIANGEQAMNAYLDFIQGKLVDEGKLMIDLFNYCKFDTYAMLKLLEELFNFVKK